MKNKIIIPAILSSYRPKADGSWGVSFSTNILSKEQKTCIDDMHNTAVMLMIKEGEITKDETEIMDAVDADLIENEKTPSKRLRNVLYIRYTQEGVKMDFKEYYKMRMEELITKEKSMLEY